MKDFLGSRRLTFLLAGTALFLVSAVAQTPSSPESLPPDTTPAPPSESAPASPGQTPPAAPALPLEPEPENMMPPPRAQPAPPPKPPYVPIPYTIPTPVKPVEEFIGHRYNEDKTGSWGWVKKTGENWRSARWVALRETPGRAVAPYRALGQREADQNFEYKLRGYFADYQVYDPHFDEMVDVFVLDGYELIGPAEELTRKPGPPDRFTSHGHRSRASSRDNQPVMSERDNGF